MKLEWGSHIHLLLPCLSFTRGPVLELGCGYYSTSLLSLYAQARYCRTIEVNSQWCEKIRNFYPAYHDIRYDFGHEIIWAENYRMAPIEDRYWTIILIDQDSSERVAMAQRVQKFSQLVIVHDTNRNELYHALDGYRFRYDFTDFYPHTSIGSDHDNLKWLVRDLQKYHPRIATEQGNDAGDTIMSTTTAADQFIEEGILIGRAEGEADAITVVLKARFGKLPKSISDAIRATTDLKVLNKLTALAATCKSLDEFTKAIS